MFSAFRIFHLKNEPVGMENMNAAWKSRQIRQGSASLSFDESGLNS